MVPVSEVELKRFKKPEYSLMPSTFEKSENGLFIHNVFDKEGRLLARLPLRSQGLKISRRKYYALEEDEDGFRYVKRYAVTWKVK